jgi:pimeloyl-ACP methyl ester carboxylesterase
MLRQTAFAPLLLAAALVTACGEDPVPTTPTEQPVAITEQAIQETLNPNGGRTHPFVVQRPGQVSAVITELAPDPAVLVGLSLGTWNGAACQIIIANDNAAVSQALVGSATGTGQFCVRVYDTGRLTQNVQYTLSITHF